MSKFNTPVVTDTQRCGCKTTRTEFKGQEPVIAYVPCLACALKNAGLMLVEAGKRMEEAIESDRVEQEELAEAMRIQSDDFIGGSD